MDSTTKITITATIKPPTCLNASRPSKRQRELIDAYYAEVRGDAGALQRCKDRHFQLYLERRARKPPSRKTEHSKRVPPKPKAVKSAIRTIQNERQKRNVDVTARIHLGARLALGVEEELEVLRDILEPGMTIEQLAKAVFKTPEDFESEWLTAQVRHYSDETLDLIDGIITEVEQFVEIEDPPCIEDIGFIETVEVCEQLEFNQFKDLTIDEVQQHIEGPNILSTFEQNGKLQMFSRVSGTIHHLLFGKRLVYGININCLSTVSTPQLLKWYSRLSSVPTCSYVNGREEIASILRSRYKLSFKSSNLTYLSRILALFHPSVPPDLFCVLNTISRDCGRAEGT